MSEVCNTKQSIIFYKDKYCFYLKKKVPLKKKVLEEMHIKNESYFGSAICRLYDYYFLNGVKLASEYKKYYKDEFDSIKDFIENVYAVDSHMADILCSEKYYVTRLEHYYESVVGLMEDSRFSKAFEDSLGGVFHEN